jgi:hypothetical protein
MMSGLRGILTSSGLFTAMSWSWYLSLSLCLSVSLSVCLSVLSVYPSVCLSAHNLHAFVITCIYEHVCIHKHVHISYITYMCTYTCTHAEPSRAPRLRGTAGRALQEDLLPIPAQHARRWGRAMQQQGVATPRPRLFFLPGLFLFSDFFLISMIFFIFTPGLRLLILRDPLPLFSRIFFIFMIHCLFSNLF